VSKTFQDYFSAVAATYAQSRPRYHGDLFAWLATQCAHHDLAWDCGTGNGQAAVHLAQHFAHVVATDASAKQIAETEPHPQIAYCVAPAERSEIPDATADLVAVAQALHWFDFEAFYREARRVLKPGGLLAAWCYGTFRVDDIEIDRAIQRFYADTVGPYWPPERRHIETGYRDIPFPFEPVSSPPFFMRADWSLPELAGYLRSWSATGRYIASTGVDPVAVLENSLVPLWGDASKARRFEWPLSLRAGRA
jgi:ubiquinone/menaquinone biosynthesis C-methylase UbiE